MKQSYIYLILLLIVFSCSEEIDIQLPKGRTLLVYIAGDNSLSNEVSDMHAALLEGWNPNTMGSLVIFVDSKGSKPVLIKLVALRGKVVSDTLRTYTNENSASPDLLRQVINDTRDLVPGESYGMLLFSHASGWLPAKAYVDPVGWRADSKEGSLITPRSIFEDNGREMDLADFATAIPDGIFEFIASEMCFMSSVETAYALRNKTQYLLASAPEILSPGFTPIYKTSLDLLYKPRADLEGFGQAFFDYFNGLDGLHQSAAISLVSTSKMESLAALTREIAPSLTQQQIDNVQVYDRNGKPNLFFDYRDYILQVATPIQMAELDELLSQIVIFKVNTPKLIKLDILRHSGFSVYIPQTIFPNLNTVYKETDWYKATH